MSTTLAPALPPQGSEEDARILAERLAAERFDGLSGRLVALDEHDTVWIVLAGRVDVQAVPVLQGQAAGTGRHLFEAWPGHLLPGTAPQAWGDASPGGGLAFQGRCAAGTVLARTTLDRLRALSLDLEALVAIERWVESLAAVTTPDPRALSTDRLEGDPEQAFPAGSVLCAPHGSIVWCTVDRARALALDDAALPLSAGDPAWPLTEANWITLPGAGVVSGHLTPSRMVTGAIWEDLDAFGRLTLRRLGAERAVLAEEDAARQARRAAWTRDRFGEGLADLGRAADERIVAPQREADAGDAWGESFALVAAAAGIDLPGGPRGTKMEAAALSAGVAFRSVKLSGDWWRGDNGPLLGFLPDEAAPDGRRAVALLPDGPRGYRASSRRGDPGQRVDAALAARLAPSVVMLYRPLPASVRSLWAMLRFGARGLRPDLLTVLLMGLLTGLLGLLTPIASGMLMEDVLPRADLGLHLAVIAGLAAAALGNAAFAVVQTIAVTRVQARVDLAAESAVWNRLLRLRSGFFRQHQTGDLADRAGGVSEIRRAVTGAATSSLLSGLFSLLSAGLLFWYSTRLALIALLFTLVVVVIEVVLFLVELPRRRRVADASGKVESLTFETLSAMPKLRAAAAEPRAFARWSSRFAEQARLRRSAAWVDSLRDVLGGVFPLIGTGLIWAGAIGVLGGGEPGQAGGATPAVLSLGAFVAFQAAFGNFLGGVISMVQAGEALVGVAPVWERLRPILLADPETGLGREPVGTLRGALSVSNVTFAYGPDMPPALDDVSFAVAPGEYVALVGPSGSGKSTLVRMLLGLEQPDTGAVYADGQDLATVDLAAFRRQVGVVIQGGQLIAGSVLENILGSAPLPESTAWEAARQAGLEQDIRDMPMRMHTVVSEGGGGLSGGQRQRLLIARALVRKPRLLIFDEATSALDNATQSEVKASLDRLNVTRIVVAHRLSTIRDVHRIVVMDRGRIVEQGGYDELMERGGLFARLTARQMA
jgi:ATP-binding cassette subfamily C protein